MILVDDGTPDRSGDIIDRLKEEDHRIVVIHQENHGVSSARNAGIVWTLMVLCISICSMLSATGNV